MEKDIIYLDYNATTPVDPAVLTEMLPYFTEQFANASSFSHAPGRVSSEAVDKAREQVAGLVNAQVKDIIFTSGATESISLAINGLVEFYGDKRCHIITSTIEHKAVLETCSALEGFDVTFLTVDEKGRIDLEELENSLRPETLLVSLHHANNEIGTVQDIAAVGCLCRQNETFFHVDAAQSFGKIPIDVEAMKIDLMSFSSHKIYGPKGVGALYLRRREPRVRLCPQILGGQQERSFRAGTLNVPGTVGFGAAAVLAQGKILENKVYVDNLTSFFIKEISYRLEGLKFNGLAENFLPGTISMSICGVNAQDLLCALPRLALSTGSACSSALPQSSHVLKAIGLSATEALSTIRISIGRLTRFEELHIALDLLVEQIPELRRKSEQTL